MTGEEAFDALVADGLIETEDPTALEYPDLTLYDDCAALSSIQVMMRTNATADVQVLFFHHGEYVPGSSRRDGTVASVERLEDDVLQISYRFEKPGDLGVNPTGITTATYAWDEDSGEVLRSGQVPEEASAAAAEESPSAGSYAPPQTEEATSGPLALNHADGVGFCFASEKEVACYGKHNNVAVLPASGEPTSRDDLPATGFEGPMPSRTLAGGESWADGPFVCTATEGGFDCENTATGSAISVAGPAMELTPAG